MSRTQAIAGLFAATMMASPGEAAGPDLSELREAWNARLDAYSSVSFHVHGTFEHPHALFRDKQPEPQHEFTLVTAVGSAVRIEGDDQHTDKNNNGGYKVIQPGRHTSHHPRLRRAWIDTTTREPRTFDRWEHDLCIGWAVQDPYFLRHDWFDVVRVEERDGGRVAVVGNVVTGREEYEFHEALNWSLTRARIQKSDGTVLVDGRVSYSADDALHPVPVAVQFVYYEDPAKPVGLGPFAKRSARPKQAVVPHQKQVRLRSRFSITDLELNAPVEASLFSEEFPDGTHVRYKYDGGPKLQTVLQWGSDACQTQPREQS
jgi:hypothetical protein